MYENGTVSRTEEKSYLRRVPLCVCVWLFVSTIPVP